MSDRYDYLKRHRPDLFKQCVEAASAIAINMGFTIHVAAMLETALVDAAISLLAPRPSGGEGGDAK